MKQGTKHGKGKRKVTFDEDKRHPSKKPRSALMKQEKQHHSFKKNNDDGVKLDTKAHTSKKSESKKDVAADKDILWNEANCDVDLDDHAASNVHFRKIKISNNLIISCKMISHLENKNLHSDYAALVFSRKTNKDKMFNFMVDMRVTERLIKALQIIIDQNPVFFNKKPMASIARS